MQITETGLYRLTETRRVRMNATSSAECPKGMQFRVTQINRAGRQFYAPELGDWQFEDFPAERVDETTRVQAISPAPVRVTPAEALRALLEFADNGTAIHPGAHVIEEARAALPQAEAQDRNHQELIEAMRGILGDCADMWQRMGYKPSTLLRAQTALATAERGA